MVWTFTAACFCGFHCVLCFSGAGRGRAWSECLPPHTPAAHLGGISLPTFSLVSSLVAARLLSTALVGTWSTLTCPVFSHSRLLKVSALSLTS